MQLSGDLQHHGHAAGTIVGPVDGLAPVSAIGIVVGPRACVPVGAEQDSGSGGRPIAGNDVATVQHRAVVATQTGMLTADFATILAELSRYPIAATVVRRRVHRPRTEGALYSDKGISRVGIKAGAYGMKAFGGGFGLFGRPIGRRQPAHGKGYDKGKENHEEEKDEFFHFLG